MMSPQEVVRDYRFDNIRAVLMILVVFGHMLELFRGELKSLIYIFIYLFHMPAFLFLTGYFARYGRERICRRLVLPYVVFQVIYLVFYWKCISNGEKELAIQFTTPYWLLWYLMTCIHFNIVLPLLDTDSPKQAAVITAALMALSYLAGFEKTIGYYLSLSRTLVFLPFFAGGYYCRKFSVKADGFRSLPGRKWAAACAVIFIACFLLFVRGHYPANALYGSNSYAASKVSSLSRILFLTAAWCGIVVLFTVTSGKRIPVLTGIGQRTMPVFLLHGFVQKLLLKYKVLHYSEIQNLALAAVITGILVYVLSRQCVMNLFRKCFS